MSDARTDFFKSGAGKESVANADTRTKFFTDPAPPAEKPARPFSPYAYYDPGFRREAGIDDADISPLQEIAPGFNRGVTALLGLPMDTATSATDLLGMGYGTAASLVTGRPAGEFFEPYDRSQVAGTGEWFSQKLDSTPLGPVTQPLSNDPGHRLVYNFAANAPGSVFGARGSVGPSLLGDLAGATAAEAGADPATQAALSLATGHLASKLDIPIEPSRVREVPEETPQQMLDRHASSQSMGAAGAAVDLQKLSPELRTAVEQAVRQTGGAVNPDVLARQIQADSLPVKVRMSPGQALGDARVISQERNARAKLPGVAEAFQEQNKALVENTRVFRDEAGPDVFSTNATEHADTIIGRYKTIDDAARADITAKYKALEDANGGQFPVNGKSFVSAADAALAKKMKTRYLPAEVRGDLDDFRDNSGMMTFEQFENLRTNLATAARTAERQGNGNAASAINVVRRELEALPIEGDAAKLKPLADAARSAAKARFDALDADPAYKAAVNESVAPDAFVRKFLISGERDNVAKLTEAMKDDPAALQTVRVATLDHLRQAAGIDAGYNGNFSQAGYNKALQALDPKLASLLDPKLAEQARTLGDVARYTQAQPSGHYVNNSNTFTAAAEHAADAIEGAVNLKMGGIPVGTWVRQNVTDRKGRKAAEEMFAPGAGLTRLSDLTTVGKEKP